MSNYPTPKELEGFLLDFTTDERYVTATRLPTYLALMEQMAQAQPHNGRGIGYHKALGWFVLEAGMEGGDPILVWCEKGVAA